MTITNKSSQTSIDGGERNANDGSLPLISVVVAVFNGAATLQRCIDSISCQTHVAKELIVIDGGSADGTKEILERQQAKFSYWISEPDDGIYHAWNKGLAQARGEWIYFIGADDYLWAPDVLYRFALELARAYPPVRVVYGQVVVVNSRDKELNRIGENWQSVRQRFQEIMCLPHTALMHHRSLFERHGTFDESYRIAGDYELLLRELVHQDALYVPDLVVAGMRHGGVSSDPVGSMTLLREFRRAQEQNGLSKPGWIWISAMARAYMRVWLWRLLGSRISAYLFDLGRLVSGKKPYWTRQ